MKKFVLAMFMFTLGCSYASAQAVFGPGSNTTYCTQDVYVCPNGTTVGRTGSNCQFVCPSTPVTCTSGNNYTGCVIPNYNQNSYYYTSGCYTYYYNGFTRTTSVTSYNCQTLPNITSYNTSPGYYTYQYNNGYWTPSNYNTQQNYWGGNSYYNYGNYYYGYYNNNSYGSTCYYSQSMGYICVSNLSY